MDNINEIQYMVKSLKAIKEVRKKLNTQIKLVASEDFRSMGLTLDVEPLRVEKGENILDSEGNLKNNYMNDFTPRFIVIDSSACNITTTEPTGCSSDLDPGTYFRIVDIVINQLDEREQTLETELKQLIDKGVCNV